MCKIVRNMNIIRDNSMQINEGGCIQKATKIINKTAAKLGKIFKKSTTITVWSIRANKTLLLAIVIMLLQIVPLTTMAAALPAPIPVAANKQPSTRQQIAEENSYISQILPNNFKSSGPIPVATNKPISTRPKLQQSYISQILPSSNKKKTHRIRSLLLDTTDMPWHNPCGGRFYGNSVDKHIMKVTIQTRKKEFRKLKNAISLANAYDFMNSAAIPINDIGDWVKHAETYRFLAVVKPKSNITLVRWHQQMQRYVGVISHLAKRLDKSRRNRNFRNNSFPAELYELLQASKKVLCAIETAINSTQIRPRIQRYTKHEMNRYIEELLTTNSRVSEIDLKYIKVKYINTTRGMMKALSKKIREMNCIIQERKHNSSYEFDSNASMSTYGSIGLTSSMSKQEDQFSDNLFNLFENNSSGGTSGSYNSVNNSKSMNDGNNKKRSKICQKILEEKKYKKRLDNKSRKPGVIIG